MDLFILIGLVVSALALAGVVVALWCSTSSDYP